MSHLYLSPILQARTGSTHGYDVVDPTRVVAATSAARRRWRSWRGPASASSSTSCRTTWPSATRTRSGPTRRGAAEFFDLDPETGRHRRFFDVDDLAGVRVEDPAVFAATHATILRLARSGLVDGVRVDHVDGLADPAGYLRRLRDEGIARVWVEKILEDGEALRAWPVEGTTGYEFLADVQNLLVDPRAEPVLTELAGESRPFEQVADEAKLELAHDMFTPEVDWLRRLAAVPEIAVALASLPVYRTYVAPARTRSTSRTVTS